MLPLSSGKDVRRPHIFSLCRSQWLRSLERI